VAQILQHGGVERVEDLRPVQGDEGNAVESLVGKLFVEKGLVGKENQRVVLRQGCFEVAAEEEVESPRCGVAYIFRSNS
jgi:hypothetical protein